MATIAITRRLALSLKSVMRRAFGSRGLMPAVCFTAAAGTLNVKAKSHDIAIEYTAPGDGPDETLWLPFQFLDDCSAIPNSSPTSVADRPSMVVRQAACQVICSNSGCTMANACRSTIVSSLGVGEADWDASCSSGTSRSRRYG